jgi:hypothetical protein
MSVVPIFLPQSIESTNKRRVFLGKLANVLSVQPKRFDPAEFKPEEPIMYSDEVSFSDRKAAHRSKAATSRRT